MKIILMGLCLIPGFLTAVSAGVRTGRVPENGLQPQIVMGDDGAQHLVYLKGEPGAADVRYAVKPPGMKDWSPAVTVNSTPGSAVATGSIRGAQLALGRDRMVHVTWNGPGSKQSPAQLFYTRGKKTFEPQRNVMGDVLCLDGGASVAAGASGTVFIVWHGARPASPQGEQHRVVFVLKSLDNGGTFAPVQVANPGDEGVCACCSLKTILTPDGRLLTLYRAARRPDQRDITLLSSRDGGTTFEKRILAPWAISGCPMSSMNMVARGRELRGAWETEGKIFAAGLDGRNPEFQVSGDNARHPAMAINAKGETLVSWSIGTGWQRGGDLGWCILDAKGHPTEQRGTLKGVPVWGFTAAYAEGDDFVILY